MKAQELRPSEELVQVLEQVRTKYGESRDLVLHAYNLALRDGFSPPQAKTFLLAELPFLSESTIRKALPQEAKDQSKIRTNFAVNKSQNTQPEEPETVKFTQPETQKPIEEIVAKGTDGKIKGDWKEKPDWETDDLPPEMQAIAAKIQQAEESLDVVVVGRYGLFDAKRTTEVLVRDLGKLKSSGWKVIELTARHIS